MQQSLIRSRRTLAVALGLFCLAGCSVSQDQEVQMGEQDAAQLNQQLPLVQDSVVNAYITELGNRMASRTSRSDLTWHFYVVNSAEANAFALPGGFIYVNRGLIDLTSNESELAGAIGHEIGHVIQRHAVKQMQKQQETSAGVSVVCMLTSACKSGLARTAINVGGTMVFAKHSRSDEAQADSEGVANTVRAGIDPRGIPSLFQKLLQERQSQPNVVAGWFADHPFEESRIQHVDGLISQLDPSQLNGLETDSPAYHAMKDRLQQLPAPPPAQPRSPPQDPASADSAQIP